MYASKLIFILYFILGFSYSTKAQLLNNIFEQKDSIYQNDTQTLRMHIEALNYIRNTEYFDMIEKGQTLFGVLLQLNSSFQPYKNILVKVGLQTRQDYGSTNFNTVQPVFSISIFKNKWRYNFGALQGTTNHGIIEPMYNIDRAITNRIENGFQSIYKSKTFFYNQFLVWNEPTYKTSTNQEKFTVGLVMDRKLFNSKIWDVSIPFNGTLAHRGGQLNGNPTPIFSRVNTAVGIKWSVNVNSKLKIRTENYWLFAADFSPNITQPYKNGNATWHTLSFMHNGFELMVNYWAGREFQSPVGSQLYTNFNPDNYEAYRQKQHIVMSRLMYTQQLYKGLKLDLRFEPFYTVEYKRFQYSYSIYLKLNLDRVLGKI